MASLYSDGSATYLLIIWVEKIISLTMKSKQKTYPLIVFLSIYTKYTSSSVLKNHKNIREFAAAYRVNISMFSTHEDIF